MDNKIIEKIMIIDEKICSHISECNLSNRGNKSQDILSSLRHYIEHIFLLMYSSGRNLDVTYDNIKLAIKYVKSKCQYRRLIKLHSFLQIVISHYVQDANNSERLMLKYIDYLYEIKNIMKNNYNLELLQNIDEFPISIDKQLVKYYKKIIERIDEIPIKKAEGGYRFYIENIKTIFRKDENIYYEITFNLATDSTKKTDRLIAYSKINILKNYASKFSFHNTEIEVDGLTMPITIINGWEVSIRDCEFKNFNQCMCGDRLSVSELEKRNLCGLLTKKRISILDIIESSDDEYKYYFNEIILNVKTVVFGNVLNQCRSIINNQSSGKNIVKYLLFTFNNNIIKAQYNSSPNNLLSSLYISNKSIPFDRMPFYFSLKDHNPTSSTLYNCYSLDEHEEEIFARTIKNNTENKRNLFTSLKDILSKDYAKEMIDKFNKKLYCKHRKDNSLKLCYDHVFINKYYEDCKYILNFLEDMSYSGIKNYSKSVQEWLGEGYAVDCIEKKEIITNIFEQSKVALLYGAAGTGKTTILNHISNYFKDKKKLYLAQTNPAVDNLKRKIITNNCEFATIAKYCNSNMNNVNYDILIIDECSTVSNADMRKVLEYKNFQLIILVGDIYQIQSIRFGNWFDFAREIISDDAIFELNKPYRAKNESLLKLWGELRKMSDKVKEVLVKNDYSLNIDKSIFSKNNDDEIVLCLNYNGLYGINNINRLIQLANEYESVVWGVNKYKVNDPVIFIETERFKPILYNNMKGKIRGILIKNKDLANESIIFDIEIDRTLTDFDVFGSNIVLVDDRYEHVNSVIQIEIFKNASEEDDDINLTTIVPFQIAYAVSFHKSQGLEYDSVKIVLTDDIQDSITHNILYTAVTRAKSKLRIYWSPEVEEKILSTIKPFSASKDLQIYNNMIKILC